MFPPYRLERLVVDTGVTSVFAVFGDGVDSVCSREMRVREDTVCNDQSTARRKVSKS